MEWSGFEWRFGKGKGIREGGSVYFAGLVGEMFVSEGWRRDEEGLIPEGREFLAHGGRCTSYQFEDVMDV